MPPRGHSLKSLRRDWRHFGIEQLKTLKDDYHMCSSPPSTGPKGIGGRIAKCRQVHPLRHLSGPLGVVITYFIFSYCVRVEFPTDGVQIWQRHRQFCNTWTTQTRTTQEYTGTFWLLLDGVDRICDYHYATSSSSMHIAWRTALIHVKSVARTMIVSRSAVADGEYGHYKHTGIEAGINVKPALNYSKFVLHRYGCEACAAPRGLQRFLHHLRHRNAAPYLWVCFSVCLGRSSVHHPVPVPACADRVHSAVRCKRLLVVRGLLGVHLHPVWTCAGLQYWCKKRRQRAHPRKKKEIRLRRQPRKQPRGRIGEASHPGPKIEYLNSPSRSRSPA